MKNAACFEKSAVAAVLSSVALLFQLGLNACVTTGRNAPMQTNDASADFAVPREWLNSRVTLEEIEGPNAAPDLIKPADSPAWRAFKSKLGPQDELWYFSSPSESFHAGAGRTGYAILRDEKQVASFVAMMN
jgi:hypothetical protein